MLLSGAAGFAQDLVPRAYLISPTRSNAVTLSYSWNDGDIVFDPSVPIEGAKGRFQISSASLYRSFGLFGRSANVVVSLPYATGNFQGTALGTRAQVYRSGLA